MAPNLQPPKAQSSVHPVALAVVGWRSMKKRPQEVVVADLSCAFGVKVRAQVEKLLFWQIHGEMAQHLQAINSKSWSTCLRFYGCVFVVC